MNTATFSVTASHALAVGYYFTYRSTSSTQSLYKNGSVTIDEAAANSAGECARPIYISAVNNNWTPGQFLKGKVIAYSIGKAMTPTQIGTWSTILNTFQTSMKRNTY
jgi:hypothetical protein